MNEDLIEFARTATAESDLIDFKREYCPEKKSAFWAEIVKDIVAFANTRGGIIVFGLSDDSSLSDFDCNHLFELDPAQISDQIRKYTSVDFSGARVVSVSRNESKLPAILVDPVETPLVFTKVGTYDIGEGQQKTAFSKGTIYFRHGAKSEPCSRIDLEDVIERRLQKIRTEWLDNIRKVVEASPGANVVVTTKVAANSDVRITSDPNAPAVRLSSLSDSHPYTQSEVIREANRLLDGDAKINTHDIQTIKFCENIDPESSPQHMSLPHAHRSPQYSKEFIDLKQSGDPPALPGRHH